MLMAPEAAVTFKVPAVVPDMVAPPVLVTSVRVPVPTLVAAV